MAGLLPGEWDWMRKEPWLRGSGGFEQRRPGLLGNIGRTALGLLSYGPFLPQVNERRRLLAEDRARESEADDLRMNLARMQMEDMTRKQQAASAEQDAIRSAMTQASLRRPGAPTPGLDPVSLPRTPGLPEQYARAAGELAGKGYAGPSMQFAEAAQKMMPRGGTDAAGVQEWQAAQASGFQGSYLDFVRAKAKAGHVAPPAPEPLEAVQLPDGRSVLLPRSQAAGMSPASPREGALPTEGERTAGNYFGRMQAAEALLGQYTPSMTDYVAAQNVMAGGAVRSAAANAVLSPEGQKYYQAAADWVRAKLRKESGAVISPQEMAQEIKTYFPVPGDSPATISQKRQARMQAMTGMQQMGGRAVGSTGMTIHPRGSPEDLATGENDPLGLFR